MKVLFLTPVSKKVNGGAIASPLLTFKNYLNGPVVALWENFWRWCQSRVRIIITVVTKSVEPAKRGKKKMRERKELACYSCGETEYELYECFECVSLICEGCLDWDETKLYVLVQNQK